MLKPLQISKLVFLDPSLQLGENSSKQLLNNSTNEMWLQKKSYYFLQETWQIFLQKINQLPFFENLYTLYRKNPSIPLSRELIERNDSFS